MPLRRVGISIGFFLWAGSAWAQAVPDRSFIPISEDLPQPSILLGVIAPEGEPEVEFVTRQDTAEFALGLPTPCPQSTPAEVAVCGSGALLALDGELSQLWTLELDQVRGGADRGAALAARRQMGLDRNACGADEICLEAMYLRQIAEVSARSLSALDGAEVVRLVQEELNTLSCGAGTPDGVAGGQTDAALARVAALEPGVDLTAGPAAAETLLALRGLPAGLCSDLTRAHGQAFLLEGHWTLAVTACAGEENAQRLMRVRLRSTTGGPTYTGQLAFGDGPFDSRIEARAVPGELTLAQFYEPSGQQVVYTFGPGPDPQTFLGRDRNGCSYILSR